MATRHNHKLTVRAAVRLIWLAAQLNTVLIVVALAQLTPNTVGHISYLPVMQFREQFPHLLSHTGVIVRHLVSFWSSRYKHVAQVNRAHF